MGDGKKFIISTLVITILFITMGKIAFDKKTVREDQINGFFDGLSNEKSLNYFSKVKGVLDQYKCMEIELTGKYPKSIFYNLVGGLPKKAVSCEPDIKIKFNEHSVSGMIYGSYNLNGAFFSEFLTGNLKIEGLNALDMLGLV